MVNGIPVIKPASYAPSKANTTPNPNNTANCIPMSFNPIPSVAFVNGIYPIPKTISAIPITASASDPFTTSTATIPNIATTIPIPINIPACIATSSIVGDAAIIVKANIA